MKKSENKVCQWFIDTTDSGLTSYLEARVSSGDQGKVKDVGCGDGITRSLWPVSYDDVAAYFERYKDFNVYVSIDNRPPSSLGTAQDFLRPKDEGVEVRSSEWFVKLQDSSSIPLTVSLGEAESISFSSGTVLALRRVELSQVPSLMSLVDVVIFCRSLPGSDPCQIFPVDPLQPT